MSSSIWTRCGGGSNLRALDFRAVRAVEAQHLVSTRKLTDTDAEQALLEELLETSKPPAVEGAPRLHYLLFTPFRYPPLRHGSRFGTRAERGVWYGSESLGACFAEVAYYRFLFLEGTAAPLEPLMVELTTFWARIATDRGVDLTAPPFDAFRKRLASPRSYRASQELGRAMREGGVEAARYFSARDRGGVNVAVFSPRAFRSRVPHDLEAWIAVATRERVEISKKEHRRSRESYAFERASFEVGGELPDPAV